MDGVHFGFLLALIFRASPLSSSQSQSQSQVISIGSPLDTTRPIVITDQFSNSGQSLFGFSSALSTSSDGGCIIIGAPAGNTSDRDYKQRQINEPGVIWRCSIARDGPSSLNNTCKILFMDPLNPQIGKADCRPNPCPAERHDGSGLGFTLAVNSERLVTCAPKWQRQFGPDNTVFKMNGICYWIPLDIALSDPFSIAPMISSGFRSQRLFPLLDRNMQLRENYPIWSWGQTGFSAHLTPAPGNELYLGAPGVNGWNGTVIKYQDQDQQQYENISSTETPTLRLRPNNNGKPQFAEFSFLRTDFIQLYLHLEYLGYAISTGVYLQHGHRLVATSAPRGGRLRGLVIVFEFPEYETPYWYATQVLQGVGFGSYFGYTLESVDVNGDGLDELFVGAPWTQVEDIEVGCVYLYTMVVGKVRPRFGRPTVICGDETDSGINSRFGSTIVGLGDVNGDGITDFAIGAPGEEAGVGAVYLYYGWAGAGSDSRIQPAIKLTPSNLGLGLQNGAAAAGFGMSIYGGVDIDKNGAPDFLIGAPLSQQVVLIRTRVHGNIEGHIDAYMEHEPDSNSLLKVLPIHASQIIVRSCARLRLRNVGNDTGTELDNGNVNYEIQVTLNVDTERGRFTILAPVEHLPLSQELEFERPSEGTVRYHASIHIQDQDHCKEWIIHRVDDLATDPNPRPIRIFQELYYKGQDDAGLAEIYTITRNSRGVPELVWANRDSGSSFCKFCLPSTRILTELHIPLAVDNCDADGVPTCKPRIQVKMGFESNLEFILGTSKELRAHAIVQNEITGETAYFPRLELKWNLYAITSPWSQECTQETSSHANVLSLHCDLGDRLQPNQTRHITVVFPMADYFAREKKETLTLWATVTSVNEPRAEVHLASILGEHVHIEANESSSIFLATDTNIDLQGSIENATFPKLKDTERDSGLESLTRITHTYTISLEGSSPLQTIFLSFWFPVRTAEAEKNGLKRKDFVHVGAPRGNMHTCRVMSRNATFYNQSRSLDGVSSNGLKSRQIPPYFNTGLGDQVDEDPSDWEFKMNVTTTTSSTHQESFTTFAHDSRDFLQRAHVTYAFRCTNLEEESDDDAQNSNCIRVDCILKHIAPRRRILIRFPLYVQSGWDARHLYMNKSKATFKPVEAKLGATGLYRPIQRFQPKVLPQEHDKVLVQSLARVYIFNREEDENVRVASFATLLSLRHGDGSEYGASLKGARLPMGWVYLISALVGLGLLIVLLYCLVKCGFFKRRRAPAGGLPEWKALRGAEENESETVG